MKKGEIGFTFIELLIVMAVISILIGIIFPRFKGMRDEENIAKTKGKLRTLQTAVESYYIHSNNAYPVSLSHVTTTTPRILSSIPTDPFSSTGASYQYVRGGTDNRFYVIYSVGTEGNGGATISNDAVSETHGSSCIFVSNAGADQLP